MVIVMTNQSDTNLTNQSSAKPAALATVANRPRKLTPWSNWVKFMEGKTTWEKVTPFLNNFSIHYGKDYFFGRNNGRE